MTIRILDACCGSRLFWFDKAEPHTTYMDRREEQFEIHGKKINVKPDVVADFRDMPFEDETFTWSDCQINVKEVLSAIPFRPLFGQQRGTTHWMTFIKF